MKELNIGVKASSELTVTSAELAVNVGSGSLEVFATPAMIMLMEIAACNCLSQYLEGGETTVGTEMNVRHISATPPGMKVTAEAELIQVSGREFTFSVKAFDEAGIIGEGAHKRFLVLGEKFTAKTMLKLK